MSGKAKTRKTYGKKIKDQSDATSTLYSLNGKGTVIASTKSASQGTINNTEVKGQFTTLATSDLNMRTFDIVDLDRLRFATSKGAGNILTASDYGIEALYSGNPETAYGMQFRVPTTKSIYLRSGGTALATFDDQNGFVTGMAITGGSLNSSIVDFNNTQSPTNPATDHVKLFADSDNSDHLTVRKSDGSEVDLEATGSSSWVGTATSALNMNGNDSEDNSNGTAKVSFNDDVDMKTNDIVNLCRIEFDEGGQTLNSTVTGIDAKSTSMEFNVGVSSGGSYEFDIDGTNVINFTSTQIKTPTEFLNDIIPASDDNYDLGSGSKRWASLSVAGSISAGSGAFASTFTSSGITYLGDNATDQINFYGKTDWKNNTTESSATTGNREGYITIKIDGTDKKLYYYS